MESELSLRKHNGLEDKVRAAIPIGPISLQNENWVCAACSAKTSSLTKAPYEIEGFRGLKDEMNENYHLRPQLDAYARLANPGFALLVDAPWGAGKTHALKRWLTDRKDTLYVSIYGAKSSSAIEEALFQTLLEGKDLKPPQGATQMLEGVAEKFTGAKIDLTGAFRRAVMKDLPQVLVIDDLERAELPLTELLSAINRFVEHEGRNLILLANQAELRDKDIKTYERTKEKVIGRIITVYPDVEAATEGFLASMEIDEHQRAAHEFLTTEKALLCSVFKTSDALNLRLLRYAMLEIARAFDMIPEELRENEEGMRYLLATFVALSIAFHGGEGLGIEGLEQETGWAHAVWNVNGQKGEAPPKSALEILQERFGEHPYVRLHSQVVSANLATAWIGKGHVDDTLLSDELRKSPVFRLQDPEAWQTLWWWPKRKSAEVEAALKIVKRQLGDKEFRDPAIIMHLAGILLALADEKIGWDSRDVVEQEVRAYINELEQDNQLPKELPRRRWGGVLFDHGNFGLGFHQKDSKEFRAIREELLEALDRSFWKANQERVKETLSLVQSDPEAFVEVIDDGGRRAGRPNYAHEPIFADADPVEVAQLLFSLEPEITHEVLSPFKRRILRMEEHASAGRPNQSTERDWLLKVRKAAHDLASEATPVRAAQIRMAIKRHLDFLDRPETTLTTAET